MSLQIVPKCFKFWINVNWTFFLFFFFLCLFHWVAFLYPVYNILPSPPSPRNILLEERKIISVGLQCQANISHRIIEWLELEGTLKTIYFQPPRFRQGHIPINQVAQGFILSGLQHCQGGDIHNFCGQPPPVPHHPQRKEFLTTI